MKRHHAFIALVCVASTAGFSPVLTRSTVIAYPDGYRHWVHVKSRLIAPTHPRYESVGGFQHVYANTLAVEGYRTRRFPEGSVVVVDWMKMTDTAGAYQEGQRIQLDVMVKDSARFASTGGWGFQRFVKDSRTELAASPTPQQCFECHDSLKSDDLVLGRYRP